MSKWNEMCNYFYWCSSVGNTLYGTALENDVDVGAVVQVVIVDNDVISEIPEDLLQASH